MTIKSTDKLTRPETKYGYIESPKEILAYLKARCEIKQIGRNKQCIDGKTPEYWLIAPAMAWEIRLHEIHVRAMETLELINVDSGDGTSWFSRANFSIPNISDGVI